MSNTDKIIKKIKKSISKKMSLNDYNDQLAGAPTGQQAINNTSTNQPTNIPTKQHAATSTPTRQPANTSTQQPVGTNTPIEQHTNRATEQHVGKKKKITFYCGQPEHEMLMELYIDSLKHNAKTDKSALICEGIRLLFKHKKN